MQFLLNITSIIIISNYEQHFHINVWFRLAMQNIDYVRKRKLTSMLYAIYMYLAAVIELKNQF